MTPCTASLLARHRRALAALLLAGVAACGSDSAPPPEPGADLRGLSCSAGDGQGWCWQQPRTPSFDVQDIHFVDSRVGWAVGEGGTVQRTADGGATWQRTGTGQRERVSQVLFVDASSGWALVAQESKLLRTLNGGASWVETTAPPMSYPLTLRLGPQGLLIVSGITQAGRFRVPATALSDDGGSTWRQPGVDGCSDLVVGDRALWCGVRRSLDGGRSFLPHPDFPPARLGGVIGAQGARVWAIVDVDTAPFYQTVGWSADGGQTWRFQPVEVPSGETSRRVEPAWLFADGSGWGFVRGSSVDAFFGHTADEGRTWQPVSLPAQAQDGGGGALDGRTWWLRTPDGALITRDAGGSFVPFALPPGFADVSQLTASRDALGAIVMRASDGRAARSVDDGVGWMAVPGATGGDAAISGLWFRDAFEGLALGAGGRLLATADGGLGWTERLRLGTQRSGAGSLHAAGGAVWLVDSDGRLQRSLDAGRSWRPVVVGSAPADPVVAARFFDARDGQATTLGCREESFGRVCDLFLHVTRDGGSTWLQRSEPLRNSAGAMAFGTPLRGVRALNIGTGVVEWSDDGGVSWQPGVVDSNALLAPDRFVWVGDRQVWAVGSTSLARSDDAGRTWQRVTVPAWPLRRGQIVQPFYRELVFADALHGWLLGDDGGVMRTTDGGLRWQLQPTGTQQSLATGFAIGPNRVWVGGDRGIVFGSATGGQ